MHKLYRDGVYIEALQDALRRLPAWLDDGSGWRSLYVGYEKPHVERLWRQIDNDHRIMLHRIHPCDALDVLFHPHPWPSAVLVLGEYEMTVGFGAGMIRPPSAMTTRLAPGSFYEMTHPDGWHGVRPLEVPSLSVMLIGRPWERTGFGKEHSHRELTYAEGAALLGDFRAVDMSTYLDP